MKKIDRREMLVESLTFVGMGVLLGATACSDDSGTPPAPDKGVGAPDQAVTKKDGSGPTADGPAKDGPMPISDQAPAGDAPAASKCSADPKSAIASNHGHELKVALAEVKAGAEKAYEIQGTGTHSHTVTISAADFKTLGSTGSLKLTTSSTGGHTHTVDLTCG
jgi:hypothetical protein